jgi:pimeloyl-ACP methyl ester carboxylesterase
MFEAIMSELCAQRRVITVDLQGHGGSAAAACATPTGTDRCARPRAWRSCPGPRTYDIYAAPALAPAVTAFLDADAL